MILSSLDEIFEGERRSAPGAGKRRKRR